MGAFSELAAADPGPEPQLCKVGRFLAESDDDDREKFAELVLDPDWPNPRIFRLMVRSGFRGSVSAVDRHVAIPQRCNCG